MDKENTSYCDAIVAFAPNWPIKRHCDSPMQMKPLDMSNTAILPYVHISTQFYNAIASLNVQLVQLDI